jgi:LDH2 family malate/lactate/ureidoglycolate dehydrogenase
MEDMHISLEELIDVSAAVLEKHGFSRSESETAARVLAEADARGIRSHGVVRLKRYLAEKDQGFIEADAEPEIVHETPVSLVVDGKRALGQKVSIFAMDRCIEKAEKSYFCFATVRNSNHFGISGYYSEMAQKRGMIGIAMTNTYPLVVPTFGRSPMLGTNPIALCIPAVRAPFHLDMATSVVPRGKIEVYQRAERPLPEGWAVDESGQPTTEAPRVIANFNAHADGGLLPLGGNGEKFGGHKGFGLAMLVDLLSAGLSLGQWSRETYTGRGGGVCHFFGAMKLEAFGDPDDIRGHVQEIVDGICASAKTEGEDKIYFHGEKEMAAREVSLRDGIAIPAALLAELRRLAT